MPRLWRYGYVLSRDRDVGADLAQATALRALDRAGQYTPGTSLDRWCHVILRSIWHNELRSRAIRRGGGLVPVEEIDLPDPSADTQVNIQARQVLSHIDGLPDAHRETVYMVYVEGYSYAEAAEMLAIPIGTVMSRLATARKRLKAEMG